MRKRWLLFTPLLFLSLSFVVAQNSGSYSTAAFDNARTNLTTGLRSAKPPFRLFETIDLSGIGDATSMAAFDGHFLAGQAGPNMTYGFFDPSGNPLWSAGFNGDGTRLNYVPAYAHGVVILGGDGTGDLRAIDVTDGSELWRSTVGNTGGRHPVVTGNLAICAGEHTVMAVEPRSGAVFWQMPVTTAAAPLAAFGTRVYFLEHATTLRAVDVRTGSTVWWVQGVAGDGAGIVATEKLVYVSNPDTSTVSAFMARSGERVFERVFPDSAISRLSGLALGSGRLFVFIEDNGEAGQSAIAALDPNSGNILWEVREPTWGISSAFLANGILYYYQDGSQRIRARDAASGALLWSQLRPGVRGMTASMLTVLESDTTVAPGATVSWVSSDPASTDDGLLVLLPDSIEVYCPTHETLVAQVASGEGQSGMILVSNVSSQAAEVCVQFFDSEGNPLALPVEMPDSPPALGRAYTANLSAQVVTPEVTTWVPPNSSSEVIVLSQETGVSVGWVRILSNQAVRAASIFQYSEAGVVVAEAGVGDSPAAASGNVFVKIGEGFNTGLALANPNDERAVITLTLLDETGSPMDAVTFNLNPLGHAAQFIAEFFEGTIDGDFRGTVVFESDLPVTVTALRTQDGLQMSSYPVGQMVR